MLTLSLPPQQPYSKDAFDVAPKALKRWLSDLPWAHTGRTAHLVLEALACTNRMRLSPSEHMRVLEELRGAGDFVEQGLRRHYVGHTFPLPAENQEVADLAATLYAEFAIGYKRVAQDLSAHRSIVDRRPLALALQRSIRYLGQQLLVSCHAYSPCAAGAWSELHQLYAYGVHHGLHRLRVRDPSYQLVTKVTAADAYKQIAMLAVADPYRLGVEELDWVFVALERWAPLVDMRPPGAQDNAPGFVVDLASDEPPGRAVPEQVGPMVRVLDTSALVALLRRQVGHTLSADAAGMPFPEVGEPPTPSSEIMISRLVQHWEARPERQTKRSKRGVPVEAVSSLTAIHAHLSNATAKIETDQPPPEPPPTMLGSPRTPARANLPPSRSSMPTVHDCELLDQSSEGCKVLWPNAPGVALQVGTLVLLLSAMGTSAGGESIAGVVRWMRRARDGGLQTGVRLLASNPVPASVRRQSESTSNAALLLPKQKLDSAVRILVLSTHPFRPGERLLVEAPSGQIPVQLEAVDTSTTSFAQLRLKQVPPDVDEALRSPERVAGTREVVERYNGLWEKL